MAAFYLNVFGLEKASLDHWSATGRFLTDGTTNLALLADAEEMRAAGRKVTIDHYKQGLTHYGFETPRVGAFNEQLPAGTRREQRLDRRDAANYYRLWDPDGNHFDLRVAGAWGGAVYCCPGDPRASAEQCGDPRRNDDATWLASLGSPPRRRARHAMLDY